MNWFRRNWLLLLSMLIAIVLPVNGAAVMVAVCIVIVAASSFGFNRNSGTGRTQLYVLLVSAAYVCAHLFTVLPPAGR